MMDFLEGIHVVVFLGGWMDGWVVMIEEEEEEKEEEEEEKEPAVELVGPFSFPKESC